VKKAKKEAVGCILSELFLFGNSAKEVRDKLFQEIRKEGFTIIMCKVAIEMYGRGKEIDDIISYMEQALRTRKFVSKK